MRFGSTRSTVTGTILSSTHFWVMPTFSATIACCAMGGCPSFVDRTPMNPALSTEMLRCQTGRGALVPGCRREVPDGPAGRRSRTSIDESNVVLGNPRTRGGNASGPGSRPQRPPPQVVVPADGRHTHCRIVAGMRWTVHGERPIYESEWMRLVLVDVEIPGGERFDHHVIRFPRGAAGTVVCDDTRGVLLLWRHRFATDTWGWEIPAGYLDAGETPEQAAEREVCEETGWRPGPLTRTRSVRPDQRRVRSHVPHLRRRRSRPRRVRPSTGRRASASNGCPPTTSVRW